MYSVVESEVQMLSQHLMVNAELYVTSEVKGHMNQAILKVSIVYIISTNCNTI